MGDRTPRDLDARLKKEREQQLYTPPSTLPNPEPRPGIVHRWVATHVLGKSDPTNVSKRMRDGWVPVKGEDYPELQLPADANGNVEVGGLMLCAMNVERAKARDEYYEQQAKAQMQSVDNHFMRNNDPRMPLFRETSSDVGRGKFSRNS